MLAQSRRVGESLKITGSAAAAEVRVVRVDSVVTLQIKVEASLPICDLQVDVPWGGTVELLGLTMGLERDRRTRVRFLIKGDRSTEVRRVNSRVAPSLNGIE
jgi:hypothetical protein